MSRWEDEFLDMPQKPEPAPEPMAPAEPKRKRAPMFVSPAAMVTKAMGTVAGRGVDAGKALFVKLPCSTC